MKVRKIGEIITKGSIPLGIPRDNINGPTVFKRPHFFPPGAKWVMYFGHHDGKSIRQATAENLKGPWTVSTNTILELKKIPGYGHLASPEVVINENFLELYYHCPYKDHQYTFKAITVDGIRWEYDTHPKAAFYLRMLDLGFAIAKFKNEGGVVYKITDGFFKEVARILPNMRHCCYSDSKLYWTNIGDSPESILRGDLDLNSFSLSNIELVLTPEEQYETGDHPIAPSKPGAAIRVNQVRDPFVLTHKNKKYLFYTVRGEEAIALATIEE